MIDRCCVTVSFCCFCVCFKVTDELSELYCFVLFPLDGLTVFSACVSVWFNTEPATERGGHEVSAMWHHRPEERRLWLDLLSDVQDRNLLGHQTSSLGPKRKKNICLYVATYPSKVAHAFDFFFSFLFFSYRAGATHPVAVDAGSTTSLVIPTARTATESNTLMNTHAAASALQCLKKGRPRLMLRLFA